MAKWKILLLAVIALLALPIVLAEALPLCDDTITLGQNCTFVTPVINCSILSYSVINLTGDVIINASPLTAFQDGQYQFDWNLVDAQADYVIRLCDGTTREVYVNTGGQTNMFIAIALGLVGIMFVLFRVSTELPEKHSILKMFMYLSGIVMGWAVANFGLQVAEESQLSADIVSAVSTAYVAFLIIGVFAFAYFMIMIILYAIRLWRFKMNEKDETDSDTVF